MHHPGSAVIVPVFDDGTIALVRQYRHPAVRYLLEAPAGTLRRGEVPEEGAARELEEELGFVAGRLEKLSEFFVSPGFCEEKMWVYLATELTETRQQLEDDEIIEVVRIPFSQALEHDHHRRDRRRQDHNRRDAGSASRRSFNVGGRLSRSLNFRVKHN